MKRKIIIYIIFFQLSGLAQSNCLYKPFEDERCENENNVILNNGTNFMSHVSNVMNYVSSLFKAISHIGTSINYIADVAADIADKNTIYLLSDDDLEIQGIRTTTDNNNSEMRSNQQNNHTEIEVEYNTKISAIIKWTTGSKADWKLFIDSVRPKKNREEIKLDPGTTIYTIKNVNEGDIIDIQFYDGTKWHETLRYEHENLNKTMQSDSKSPSTSRSGITETSSGSDFKIENGTNGSPIIRWTTGSKADWKLFIDSVRPKKDREEIKLDPGTTIYTIKNVNEGDIIDIQFYDGTKWHETLRYEHHNSECRTIRF